MSADEKLPILQDIGAYGVGLAVTVISAVLTGPIIPIPFNLLISLGLGGTAWYGSHKLLHPWTPAEREERDAARRYKGMLHDIAAIGARTADSGLLRCIDSDISRHIISIARKIDMVERRYRKGARDFAGASKTLLVLQKFDEILTHYVKLKCGELFLDKGQADRDIADIEGRILPLIEDALEELGRKIDAGESVAMEIHKGTLEDMLRSLDLIKSQQPNLKPPAKEGSDDT